MNRTSIKIAGSSGSGLVITGQMMMHALKHLGYYINSDREYPSLIKGGYANYQVDFGTQPLHSLSEHIDLVLAVDRIGLMNSIDCMGEGDIVIHDDDRHMMIPGLDAKAREKGIQMVHIPARKIAHDNGGNLLMTNMVSLGLAWRILGLPYEVIADEVREKFKNKPKLLEIDLKCLEAGYKATDVAHVPEMDVEHPESVPDTILLEGNTAVGLGAIHAGVRAYFAYPMSPSSSILSYMTKTAHQTGIAVKQGEDEITVAQMTLGAMHMGTRALCATSGGGYDLMTETVSLAAIIETPFVVVICQRPGPATGLPTWTCQGDLNLAIGSAHGEFARVVIGLSDPTSCFELMQHAFNIAEKYQVPVIVLSEKVVCETKRTVAPFEQGVIPIERGLITANKELEELKPSDRYKFTDSGVSPRWLPGASQANYYANSDEHRTDGCVTEMAEEVIPMVEKRMRKEHTIIDALPEPEIFGAESGADVSFIGWGSTKNVMLDVIRACKEKGIAVNYLHYDYVWPFKKEAAEKFFAENENVCLLEGNYLGQFGQIVEDKTGTKFDKKFLKYDGRQFFFEEVMRYVHEMIKN